VYAWNRPKLQGGEGGGGGGKEEVRADAKMYVLVLTVSGSMGTTPETNTHPSLWWEGREPASKPGSMPLDTASQQASQQASKPAKQRSSDFCSPACPIRINRSTNQNKYINQSAV